MLMSTSLSLSYEPYVNRLYQTESGCGLTIESGRSGEKQISLSFSDSDERLAWAQDVYDKARKAHDDLLEAVVEQTGTAPF